MDAYEDRSFRTNVAVGLFTLTALAGLALGIVFFLARESPLTRTYAVEVRFADVAGLKSGAPVTLMGASIGRVASLSVSEPAPPTRPATTWLARLAVRDEPWIRGKLTTTTVFTVQPESLFGNKFVNATFGDGGRPLAAEERVEGQVAPAVDSRTFEKLSVALDEFAGAAKDVRGMLAPLAGTPAPGSAVAASSGAGRVSGIDGAPPEPGAVTVAANPANALKDAVTDLGETLKNAAEASRALKDALTPENQTRMKATFDDLSKSAANLSEVTQRMKQGMDSWTESLERLRFWRNWFGDGRQKAAEKPEEGAKETGPAKAAPSGEPQPRAEPQPRVEPAPRRRGR